MSSCFHEAAAVWSRRLRRRRHRRPFVPANKQADWSRFAQVHGKAGAQQVMSHDLVSHHRLPIYQLSKPSCIVSYSAVKTGRRRHQTPPPLPATLSVFIKTSKDLFFSKASETNRGMQFIFFFLLFIIFIIINVFF